MVDASTGSSIMIMDVDDAYELYERIVETQSMWPNDKEVHKKIVGIHNVDAMTALEARMEAIMKKLDTLTHSVNMVQTPTLVCTGYGPDHITASYPLASTHMGQLVEVIYAQNF